MSRLVKFRDVNLDNQDYFYTVTNVQEPNQKPTYKAGFDEQMTAAKAQAEIILAQAGTEARSLIAVAQNVSREIRAFATGKAHAEVQKATESGYEAGYRCGMEEVAQQQKAALDELENLMKRLESQKSALLLENEEQIKELALGIAKKVIDEKLSANDKTFLNIFNKAVKNFSAQEWVKVTVSDHDVQFATSNSQLLMSMVKGARDIEIVILEGAPKGTCIVETAEGIADASVYTQINNLKKAFTGA